MPFSDFWSGKKPWNVAMGEGGLRLWQRADQIFEVDADQAEKLCTLLRKPPVLPVNTLSCTPHRDRVYVLRVHDHVELRRGARVGSMSLEDARALAERVAALTTPAGHSARTMEGAGSAALAE